MESKTGATIKLSEATNKELIEYIDGMLRAKHDTLPDDKLSDFLQDLTEYFVFATARNVASLQDIHDIQEVLEGVCKMLVDTTFDMRKESQKIDISK